MNSELIYVDGVGVNIWTKRKYGRSKAGERCFQVVGGIRGQNVTVCTATCNSGIVHYRTTIGGFNREEYNGFLSELSQILLLRQNQRFSVVMDNVSFHHNIANFPDNIVSIYLPPYLPFLNPIESVFSVFKNNLRLLLGNVSFQERRERLLTYIQEAFEIDGEIMSNFYRHSASYLWQNVYLKKTFQVINKLSLYTRLHSYR